jgi:hypothetical protein
MAALSASAIFVDEFHRFQQMGAYGFVLYRECRENDGHGLERGHTSKVPPSRLAGRGVGQRTLANPPRLSVSVSVSFSTVHGRSEETAALSRSQGQPPTNPGERPRTQPTTPPQHLEGVLVPPPGRAEDVRVDAEQVRSLIEVLLDPSADVGERDDAAMDLYATRDPRARAALLTVARDESTPDIVRASAGESLGQIAVATGCPLSESDRARLTPEARREYDVFHETAHVKAGLE